MSNTDSLAAKKRCHVCSQPATFSVSPKVLLLRSQKKLALVLFSEMCMKEFKEKIKCGYMWVTLDIWTQNNKRQSETHQERGGLNCLDHGIKKLFLLHVHLKLWQLKIRPNSEATIAQPSRKKVFIFLGLLNFTNNKLKNLIIVINLINS